MKEIATRKDSEEELFRLRNEYQQIFESDVNLTTLIDPNLNIINANRAAADIAGKSKKEIVGKKCYKIFNNAAEPPKECPALKIINSGLPEHIQSEITASGRTFIVNCTPLFDKTGRLEKIIHVAIDITRRKQAEERLYKSEAKYRELVQNANSIILRMDTKGNIRFFNEFAQVFFGYTEDYCLGRNVVGTIVPEKDSSGHDLTAMIKDIGKHPERYTHNENENMRRDGERVWVAWTNKAIYDDRGHIVEILCIGNDITARKQMEEALADEKERLRVTLRSIGEGVIASDAKDKIVLINKVAEELTGWSQNTAIGRPVHEVFHIINKETGKPCEYLFQKMLETGSVTNIDRDTILIAKDGTERLIDDSCAPILDKKSSIIGVIFVFRDITDKQKMEQELLKVQKLESIGILAGGIAHDFNNLLTGIMGNISLAQINSTSPDKVRARLQESEHGCLRAKDLTMQLLTFSKGGKPVKKTLCLPELLTGCSKFALSGSNVKCRFFMPDDLWPVEADKGQLNQVINNLLINADQAMPEGGIIELHGENIILKEKEHPSLVEGKYAKISITDNGCGISKRNLSKIFDPYFSSKQNGSGLGLASVYSIIKRHKGHITAESEPGSGTTITTYLPASDKTTHSSKTECSDTLGCSGKILIMDDEEIILEVLGEILRHLGYKPEFARDGNEAVELYKKAKETGHPFSGVIMDLTIPGGIGGKETIKKLIKVEPKVKAIVSSGYSDDPVMADFRRYGFSGVITKPFKINELSGLLQKILS